MVQRLARVSGHFPGRRPWLDVEAPSIKVTDSFGQAAQVLPIMEDQILCHYECRSFPISRVQLESCPRPETGRETVQDRTCRPVVEPVLPAILQSAAFRLCSSCRIQAGESRLQDRSGPNWDP